MRTTPRTATPPGPPPRAGGGLVAAVLALVALAGCRRAEAPRATHGVAAGEVTHASAVIWSRGSAPGTLVVEVRAGERVVATAEAPVTAERDLTAQVQVEGLAPATEHRYAVRFASEGGALGPASEGRFVTAAAPATPAAVRLAWSGDLAGQNVCRDAAEGFPVFAAIERFAPELFIGLGDMIYADDVCLAVGRYGNAQVPGDFGPATTLSGFRAHWRYAREDAGLRRLLASAAYLGVWDDHEVVNDWGPADDRPRGREEELGPALMPLGRRAFEEYTPLRPGRDRLWRAVRRGRHLELFVLDTRGHRAPNARPDTGSEPKSLLGAEQRAWLVRSMAASDATWKVVVSSVPISIPTGSEAGRDGWSDWRQDGGFERELLAILSELRAAGVANQVWITTDVHFATGFRYRPLAQDPSWELWELVVGPLNAGLFPTDALDPTLSPERLFLYGPSAPPTSWAEARRWMNFGTLEIDAAGVLTASVRDVDGALVWSTVLEPR